MKIDGFVKKKTRSAEEEEGVGVMRLVGGKGKRVRVEREKGR